MKKTGILLVVVIMSAGSAALVEAGTVTLDATTDTGGNGWAAILPAGATTNNCYPCADPILTDPYALAFEAANSGFNSDPNYDASAWQPYINDLTPGNQLWIDNLGTNPFFARDVFDIPGTPVSGTFSMEVDDDSLVWVNGVLVPGLIDASGGTGPTQTADITPYLVDGENVIAFLADNAAGGGFGVYVANGTITYTSATPEPQSLALATLGILAVLTIGRRRNPAAAAVVGHRTR